MKYINSKGMFASIFITKEQLVELAQPLLKTEYGQYLIDVSEGL